MKPKLPLAVVHIFFVACLSMTVGCKKSQDNHMRSVTYTMYDPIFIQRSEVYADINGDAAESIINAGKIYIQGDYIFINEIDKGIHVIDNSNPSHPIQTAFWNIPGNRDIAVRSNVLYADMYSELLAINIENVHEVSIASELKDVFPARGGWSGGDTSGVVIGYRSRDTTVLVSDQPAIGDCPNCDFMEFASTSAVKSTSGKAGSMAGMVLINEQLYAITESHSLSVIDLSEPATPKLVSTVYAGFDLETIFPFEGKLFLGSATGMYMYDVSDWQHPQQLGTFSHGRACDPVIADGQYAYVTLHAGTSCGGDANELNVINIQDLMNPVLVKSYPMTKPGGLSKDGNLLFVCDGSDGVKVLNAADPKKVQFLAEMKCPDPYDVITGNQTAIVVAKAGVYQFDYRDPGHIRQISMLRTHIQ